MRKQVVAVSLAALAAFGGLAACDQEDVRDVEEVGEDIGNEVEDVGENIEQEIDEADKDGKDD